MPDVRRPATARELQLDRRGTIVHGVDLTMACLQAMYPRRSFPEFPDGDRYPVLDDPWRRGGTSPGGAGFAGPVGPDGQVVPDAAGNYFVGWPDEMTEAVAPQRVVWTPPLPGQERFVPPRQNGFNYDESPDYGAGVVRQPVTPQDLQYGTVQGDLVGGSGPTLAQSPPASQAQTLVQGGGGRAMGSPYVTAWVLTRVVPMTAHVWGSDWDDTEELYLWLATAASSVWQGTVDGANVVESGGLVRDEKGTRGLHGVLTVLFACPVIWPPMWERPVSAVSTAVGSLRWPGT